jgi:hypothetical protein
LCSNLNDIVLMHIKHCDQKLCSRIRDTLQGYTVSLLREAETSAQIRVLFLSCLYRWQNKTPQLQGRKKVAVLKRNYRWSLKSKQKLKRTIVSRGKVAYIYLYIYVTFTTQSGLWDIKVWSRVPRGPEERMAVLAKPAAIYPKPKIYTLRYRGGQENHLGQAPSLGGGGIPNTLLFNLNNQIILK